MVSVCSMHVELDDVQGEKITVKGPQSCPCPMSRLEHAIEGKPIFHGRGQTRKLEGWGRIGRVVNTCRGGNVFAGKQNVVREPGLGGCSNASSGSRAAEVGPLLHEIDLHQHQELSIRRQQELGQPRRGADATTGRPSRRADTNTAGILDQGPVWSKLGRSMKRSMQAPSSRCPL